MHLRWAVRNLASKARFYGEIANVSVRSSSAAAYTSSSFTRTALDISKEGENCNIGSEMLQQSTSMIIRSLKRRGFCTSAPEKIISSVVFERLPVVIPKIDPVVYAFHEFSFRWRQQYQRKYPKDILDKSDSKGKGDYHIDYVPAPRITEADKTNDRKSLNRALDRRLYLLLYGSTYGTSEKKPVWHFPEKVYESEDTLRKCAESALKSIIGDLSHTYFVGNAPFAHMAVQLKEDMPKLSPFKRFFFKSQVIGTNKFKIGKCEDHVWVTKDELREYFPEQAAFLNQILIS